MGVSKAAKVKDARALLRKHFDDDWEPVENLFYYHLTLQEPEIPDYDEVEEVEDGMIREKTEDLRISVPPFFV
ncbi:hypothetical protein PR048_004353 [Dryococelus australis]|uniref:Uncharacterized protein n=1 Tax=Dryococelus australis TaxID=614101 RepID=A0ABQ9I572_9NEOP|nr:hypothetical protein PR048_004353 [Dryococelus australis]